MIDLDGIAGRVVALPIEAGTIQDLAAGAEGQILYIRRADVRPGQGPAGHGKPSLRRFDLKTREEETLAEGIDDFRLSADRKKLLYRAGDARGTVPPGAPRARRRGPGDRRRGQVQQGGRGARSSTRSRCGSSRGRNGRRSSARPGGSTAITSMPPTCTAPTGTRCGVKYQSLLPDLASRDDLNRVIRMMLSELAVGHSYLVGGERLYEPKPIPVGLLGADYEVADGRFRFKTIYGGAYWDPSLRAPLAAPGVDVKPGDFLLAVDGREIKADSEVYRAFEGTAGKRRRAQGRPQGRRDRCPHGRRRADRRRGRAAQPRLGRGQPPQGPRADQGPRRLCLCAQYGRSGI